MSEITKTEPINKDTLPIIIDRVILALNDAKTFSEKEEAIIKAGITFDILDKAKKLHSGLEIKLEEAKAELIIAIDRSKIELKKMYDKVKKKKGGRPSSEKEKENPAEPRQGSTKQKTSNDHQRMSETAKIIAFDKKHPGAREARINDMPKKGERVTKGISLKIVKDYEKDKEKIRFDKDKREKEHFQSQNKSINMVVREYEQQAINGLDKAKIAIERIIEIIRVNNTITLDEHLISILNKWRYFLAKLHEVYPFEKSYDPNEKSVKNVTIIDLKANKKNNE